jgi:hypothetical protein
MQKDGLAAIDKIVQRALWLGAKKSRVDPAETLSSPSQSVSFYREVLACGLERKG